MEIKQSNYIEYIQIFQDQLKEILLFPSYSVDLTDYEILTHRWNSKEELLQNLSNKLQANDIDWHKIYNESPENERLLYLKNTNAKKQYLYNYGYLTQINKEPNYIEIKEYKDLRGLLIKDYHFVKKDIFDFASFDYCIIDNCTFENINFLGADLNHVWLFDSKFINCWILGNIQNSIFTSCSFEKTTFQKLADSKFNTNVFFICELKKVSININPKDFAFISCGKIELLNKEYSTCGFEEAGSKILNEFKNKLSAKRYDSIKKDIYNDFKSYFIEMNKVFNENYSHEKFLRSYYAYKLCDDYSQNNYRFKISYWFGRYIFAYGLKSKQPLIALGFLTVISTFVFLFGGIAYDNKYINRDCIFNINECLGTIKDFIDCWYISFCSVLNIGLNFGINTLGINIFKSVLSLIGIILMTIFTFNLARKYIR